MALPNVPHQIGRVTSGDVTIFYRRFGSPGRTPILVMHGANYFDSYDWIGVAGALATDREVIAFDRRGWGESSWSPSKDYSLDAHVDDALAVASVMRWNKLIVMGHSASARVVVSLAANFADKVAGTIVVDPLMQIEAPAAGSGQRPTTGNPPRSRPVMAMTMPMAAKVTRLTTSERHPARKPPFPLSQKSPVSQLHLIYPRAVVLLLIVPV